MSFCANSPRNAQTVKTQRPSSHLIDASSSSVGKSQKQDLSFLMDLSREMSDIFSKANPKRKVADPTDKYAEY